MKTTILVALLAAFTLGFTACKKDKSATDSLSGTIWVWESGNESEVLSFTDDKHVSVSDSTDGQLTVSMDVTYSYDAPNVAIHILGETISGSVDGDKMTLTDGSDIKEYHKK